MTDARHIPVLGREAVDALKVQSGGIYVDGTLGAGGYAREILGRADCRLYAFDRDPTAIERARLWEAEYGARLSLINAPFGDMSARLNENGVSQIDGAVFDLGVSSMQLDEAERGFSFRSSGPLSMRMDCGRPNARDVVANAELEDLAAIFRIYGEEKQAGRIARAIIAARQIDQIETTGELAGIIEQAQPRRHNDKIHPATRAFQALRIFVNDELGELARALLACEQMLKPGGRLAVVTFHSLEDRIVKRFLAARIETAAGQGSRFQPQQERMQTATFEFGMEKTVTPGADEIQRNPRARSARLRIAIRNDALATPAGVDEVATPLRISRTLQNIMYGKEAEGAE